MSTPKDRKKKKKNKKIIESEILAILQKGMKTALDKALDEIFKEWK